MSWIMIHPATPEMQDKLHDRSIRFAERHGISLDLIEYASSPQVLIEAYFEQERNRWGFYEPEYYLYKRVVARALEHPQATGIAYGYVGCTEKAS